MNDDSKDSGLPDFDELTRLEEPETEVEAPSRIGCYRILQTLGQGGMGIVYEAEQERPVHRRVALKVIKLGMDTEQVVARFESERQALALMNHPNIARVYDAGATGEGRPYFVMELVRGIPITEYCTRNKLDPAARLELFIQVCEGVQHAHQKGIIHRDIKPSNVLVQEQDSKRVPKIIDFGIAKATSQRLTDKTMYTAMGQLLGTPEYMSPEQAEMSGLDIDTRTDVYLLGVLLYEILTDELPFDVGQLKTEGFDRFRRRILEEEPRRPSTRVTEAKSQGAGQHQIRQTLSRQLKGDLDWITMKALEKDRTRRYPSASELAIDVRRHLNNEPVLAGPPSNVYRVRKFVRRHRAGTVFAAVVLVLLAGFTAALGVMVRRLAAERDRAQLEATTAQEVSGFLEKLFESSDPQKALGETTTVREILDQAAARIETNLDEQPRVRARLMRTIGNVYGNLGQSRDMTARSRDLLERALELQQETLGPDALEVAETLSSLAKFVGSIGEFDRAGEYHEEALRIRIEHFGEDDLQVASSMQNLAVVLHLAGQRERALEYFEKAFAIIDRKAAPDNPDRATILNNQAGLQQANGNLPEARRLYERALELRETHLPPDDPDIARTQVNLGNLLAKMGLHAAARQHHLRALEQLEKVWGKDHRKVAESLIGIAFLDLRTGNREAAEQARGRALEIYDAQGMLENPFVLYDEARYAALGGDEAAALRYLRQAVVEQGFKSAGDVLAEPDFAVLRDSAEFRAILGDREARDAATRAPD